MGANRIIVPAFLLMTAVMIAAIGLTAVPAGPTRTVVLAASGVDGLLALWFLVFGTPARRR